MNRVFITGATGYIGNRLALRLARNGTVVHALIRSPQKKHYLEHPNIRLCFGDLSCQQFLEDAMGTCEGVYHTAAYARLWDGGSGIFNAVNFEGTRNILSAALKTDSMQKVVLTSTAGVLGASADGEPLNERSVPLKPLATAYLQSKARAEGLVPQFVRDGLDVVIVNPTKIYGPGLNSPGNPITAVIRNYLNGRPFFLPGHGKISANWSYIDDVVEGHILAMHRGVPGERYILGGCNASYAEFFGLVRRLSGTILPFIHVPTVLLTGFAHVSTIWANLT
ncbi:MAG: NAD-dependent epimerase/dehydratase family protein, partial [Saprospiraceae bacterium]|nr:NAD-dependent epimerase/dehydratase family protein [Saprospiraceae bacterium]